MASALSSLDYEFLRPLTQGWISKIEGATRGRKKWEEVADEAEMFYSRSAAAMWDDVYSRKFWRNVKAPKFRITINKAFELVAVFGPNLLWDTPTRTVTPKKKHQIPPELAQANPNLVPLYQAMGQQAMAEAATDKVIAELLTMWLNYTPRESPEGGLAQQSELAVLDALITGRGVLHAKPYTYPGSTHTITCGIRVDPHDLFIDPDFKSIETAKWIAIKHIDPTWSVERRFQLPSGSLKDRATLESSWSTGEYAGNEGKGNPHRVAGQTNDLIVWYEIYSKTGVGARLTGMDDSVKDHLEKVVGDYAYLAIAPSCAYPLNCSSDFLKSGASESEVKERFMWPVPLWKVNRWPISCLDFYPDTSSAWPIAPLGPALGELKLLNFLVPWLCNRTYSSMRDFWAVAGPHVDHYRRYLEDGDDLSIIPTPNGTDDVKKVVQILSGPQANMDVWKVIDLVSNLFDKRTGLTEFAYGNNVDGTQNRTAAETETKARAVGVRPEHMQNKVVAWQSGFAKLEGLLTRWFVNPKDVEPMMGKVGRMLWEQFITSTDVELVFHQMSFAIEAASIRRPNRDRDIANLNEVMRTHGPIASKYGETTGNYQPWNAVMKKWADLHDMDIDDAMIPEQQPDPVQQQQQQLELQQMAADIQQTQADAAQKMAAAQGAGQEMQLQAQLEQQKAANQMQLEQQKTGAQLEAKKMEVGMNLQAKQAELQMDAQKSAIELKLEQAKAAAEMAMDQQRHRQEMAQDQQSHVMDLIQGRQQFGQQMAQQKQQLQSSKEMGKVKVQQTKALAKAKPKPVGAK